MKRNWIQTRLLTAGFFLCLFGAAAQADIHYVSVNSPFPEAPYTNWNTAASTIQDAVDASATNDIVLVSNGVYEVGGRGMGLSSNRVEVDRPILVQSVNGPEVTVIRGSYHSETETNGEASVRCVWMVSNAVLSGFTLTRGSTPDQGGGAFQGILENCILSSNAAMSGGGAYESTLVGCRLYGNGADFGGGAAECILSNCMLYGNAALEGGGANASWLYNCLVLSNSGFVGGGGTAHGVLNNCTVVGNYCETMGGGCFFGTLNNSIVYFNTAFSGTHNAESPTANYTCTTPLPGSGEGNITNMPLFRETNSWSDLRLAYGSPCIDAGSNGFVASASDLIGNPRIIGSRVDMGAYESTGLTDQGVPWSWLLGYGLPADGTADLLDPDGDHCITRDEYRENTHPADPFSSCLVIGAFAVTGSGWSISWPASTGSSYRITQSTNLSWGFDSVVMSNVSAEPPGNVFTADFSSITGAVYIRAERE